MVGIDLFAIHMMLADGPLAGPVVGKADNCPEVGLAVVVMCVALMAFEIEEVVS